MRFRTSSTALAALLALAGCSQLDPVPPYEPVTDPARLFQRLTLDYPAVNLSTTAPYNTIQLTATAWSAAGTPLADAPTPTFHTLDTSVVALTPDGFLTAVKTANEVKVIAELVLDGVRQSDTAVVKIRNLPAPPTLASLSIDVPPEQAEWYAPKAGTANGFSQIAGLYSNPTMSPVALGTNGNPISGLVYEYRSLDPELALVDRRSGKVTPLRQGYAHVVIQSTAYGVTKVDTATFVVQPPFGGDFFADDDPPGMGRRFFVTNQNSVVASPTVTIVSGGVVVWISQDDEPVDVVFDDPTNVGLAQPELCVGLMEASFGPGDYCGTGDIASFVGGNEAADPNGLPAFRFRRFPVAGVYPFHSTQTGATGRVVVLERTPPLP